MSNIDCGQPGSLDGRACVNKYLKEVVRVLFVPRFKSNGERFEFDTLVAITSEAITLAVNDSNVYDRMLPSNKLAEYVSERGEDVIYDAGYFQIKLDESSKVITIVDPKGDHITKAAFDRLRNGGYDVFLVDKNGTIRSYYDETYTKVRPLPVIDGGIASTQMDYSLSDSKPERVEIKITLDQSVVDERIFDVTASELGFSILEYTNPLIQGSPNFTSYTTPTTTTVTATLKTSRNTPITGVTLADVTGSVIGGSALNISAVTETSTGVYDIVYTGAVSTDVLNFVYSRTGVAFETINAMSTEPTT